MAINLVGIFWVMRGKNLLVYAIEWDKATDIVGNWCNYGGHYEYWEEYIRKQSLDNDYTDFPRGRVIFNKKTKVTKILSSKKVIGNKELVNQIAEAFHLKKYQLRSDEHYEDPI